MRIDGAERADNSSAGVPRTRAVLCGRRGVAAQLADVQIEEAGNDVRAWLEHVNEFLKDEQWSDAVDTLRRVMENRGDRLIETPVDAQWQALGFAAYVPLSEYCQMQLACWHARAPQALAIYRQQVEGLASAPTRRRSRRAARRSCSALWTSCC